MMFVFCKNKPIELESPFSSWSASSANSAASRPGMARLRRAARAARARAATHQQQRTGATSRRLPGPPRSSNSGCSPSASPPAPQPVSAHRTQRTARVPAYILGDELRHAGAHALRHVGDGQLITFVELQKSVYHLCSAESGSAQAHDATTEAANQRKLGHQLLVVPLGRGAALLRCRQCISRRRAARRAGRYVPQKTCGHK